MESCGIIRKMGLRKRNDEIVRKRKAGATYRAISSEFGLSPGRIQQIVQESIIEKKCQERSAKLVGEIRRFDEINKSWPTETLINDLQLPWKGRQCLRNHFCCHKTDEISLKNIMDFLIPNFEEIPDNFYEACPAFKQNNVGHKTYYGLIHFFSEQDFGHAFQIEWMIRLRKLMRCLKERGSYISDSLRQYDKV